MRKQVPLLENNWLDATEAARLASIWRFGKLIANSDMHSGNASFLFGSEKPVRLAPVYDMLPMAYRPDTSSGRVPREPVVPAAAELSAASSGERAMAQAFWKNLSSSPMVSEDFRRLAKVHARSFPPH